MARRDEKPPTGSAAISCFQFAQSLCDCNTVLDLTGNVCGDGSVGGPEGCDDGSVVDETACPYSLTSCAPCKSDCSGTIASLPVSYCGDGTVQNSNGEGEACDDHNTDACGRCDASCNVFASASATGYLVAAAASVLQDNDQFQISNGFGVIKTFEFDKLGNGKSDPMNANLIAVTTGATDRAETMRNNIDSAIGGAGATPGALRVLALGPDPDWRERGISYDGFMADRVAAEVEANRRVLVYCGIHHGFTRYHQPELDLRGKARAFMDRMGNILRRRFGERVFLITLPRPVWCGKEPWDYCLPLGGAIDCAAATSGRPVGFDVAGTELGARTVGASSYSAQGYAALRFDEMMDGYIWFGPLESYEDVRSSSLLLSRSCGRGCRGG